MDKGNLIVISGPSGVGKGEVIKKIRAKRKDLKLSVSRTTREIRSHETEGVEYYFTSVVDFEKLINEDGFLEWTKIFNNYYGTPKKEIEMLLNSGHDVILEIDVVGGENIKKFYPKAIMIFMLPPSKEVLYERLKNRGTESAEQMNIRKERATKEFGFALNYDYAVINENIENTADSIIEIIDYCLGNKKELNDKYTIENNKEFLKNLFK